MQSLNVGPARTLLRTAIAIAALQVSCGDSGSKCPVSAPNCNTPAPTTPTVVSVTISGAPASMTISQTAQLTATVAVTSGAGVAVVRGVAAGNATITATSVADTKRAASAAITVTATAQAVTRWTSTRVPTINGPTGFVQGMWGTTATNVYAVSSDGDIA